MKKLAVLTGAGFSRNWGGFLADELCAQVHSHRALAPHPGIREKLIQLGFDYEQALHDLRDHEGFAEFMQALLDAFELHDKIVKQANVRDHYHCFGKLLRDLHRASEGNFRFFTLNQDLLVERFDMPEVHARSVRIVCPGANTTSLRNGMPIEEARRITTLRNIMNVSFADDEIAYCKLHGSCHWAVEGSPYPMLIAGKEKEADIARFPLLKALWDDFKEFSNDATFLVIGYGFRDQHVNRELAKHGNRVFVIDTNPLPDIAKRLDSALRQRLIGGRNRPLFDLLAGRPKHPTPMLEDLFSLLTAETG